MKKKTFSLLFVLMALSSPLFAVTLGSGLDSDIQSAMSPLKTIFLVLKVAAVCVLVFFVLKTVIQVLHAEQQQRGQILLHNLIYIGVASVGIMLAFGLPKLLGLDKVMSVDDSGSAVIRIEVDDEKGSVDKQEYNLSYGGTIKVDVDSNGKAEYDITDGREELLDRWNDGGLVEDLNDGIDFEFGIEVPNKFNVGRKIGNMNIVLDKIVSYSIKKNDLDRSVRKALFDRAKELEKYNSKFRECKTIDDFWQYIETRQKQANK